MKIKWKIKDLIDLEYFLLRNNTGTGKTGNDDSGFDRRTYLEFVRSHPEPHGRAELIRYWLDRRRESELRASEAPATLPGTAYTEIAGLSRAIFAFLAFAAGWALAWGLLSYQGRQPINVFTCLWVMVIPQVLLLIIFLAATVIQRTRLVRSVRILYPFMAQLFRYVFRRLSRAAGKRLSADKRNQIASAMGLFGQARTVYGSVFFYPLFITLQMIGVLFNIGIVGALLLRVTITDLAFGWQSTLQPDPQTVYRIVDAISLPWQWFTAPPISHPTMAQIAGSKMVLKEGIYHLATENLVAWWPFLCLAIVFYSFVPRIIMLLTGLYLKRRSLRSVDFGHSACDRLIGRMQTPLVDTASAPYLENSNVTEPAVLSSGSRYEKSIPVTKTPAILMVPGEIAEKIAESEIRDSLGHFLALTPEAVFPVWNDMDLDAPPIEKALEDLSDTDRIRLVILQEAWQPPIKESLSWLAGIRELAGKQIGIIIALVGKPVSGNFLTIPAETDRVIWEQSVASMGDPYMRVEIIGS